MRYLSCLVLFPIVGFAPVLADDSKALEHFEKKIRPILTEHCYKCHSEESQKAGKLKGGLRLDTKEALLKGGDSGPAVVPGKPNEGTLLKSLRYMGDVQMPPAGKLDSKIIKDFEDWIVAGAPDPRTGSTNEAKKIDLEAGKKHWSFQPPKSVPAPQALNAEWNRNPIDQWIAAGYAQKKLTPVAPADRATLIRRVTFDLIGLPPTPEEIENFVNDPAADAFEKLVDRLLKSPAYGERWGRHWLDVARYSEDQAHTFAVKPKTQAWRYRDWVIQAFNEDMPYDQFLRFQIAGDLLPESVGPPSLRYPGLGFIGLGAEYYKNTQKEVAIADELDDRVDTLTRGLLGLTVSCARCHDHKFDPIPTRDYYSLAGIFNGFNPADLPLASPEEVRVYQEAAGKLKQIEDRLKNLVASKAKETAQQGISKTNEYALTAWKMVVWKQSGGKPNLTQIAQQQNLQVYFLDRWVKALEGNSRPTQFLRDALMKELPKNIKKWEEITPPEGISKAIEQLHTQATQAKLAPPIQQGLVQDPTAPFFVDVNNWEKTFGTADTKKELDEIRQQIDAQKKSMPPAPPIAHGISGGGKEMKVYIRGNPYKQGEPAPKGFLQILPHSLHKDYSRLNLADDLINPKNPLTARVIVNRVWAWHFGKGIVNTPSNFGLLGEKPTHPELLDDLAVRFMQNGWSIKWLHRQILNSKTYQLSAQDHTENASIDGDNRYLWRANRRRLDVESWRDSLLSVSGLLDTTMGGPTGDLRNPNYKRRTVYAKVSRHELDSLLRLFDFPDANVSAEKRNETTVPQQQLFALNSEFMTIQAKAFAARLEKLAQDDSERVKKAFQLAFGRPVQEKELALTLAYLKLPVDPQKDKLSRWEQLAQALLAANEFMYVD